MSGNDNKEPEAVELTRTASLGYQVNHLARLLEQSLRTRIAHLGVVPGQFAQLLALYEEDGITQTELSARVRIDQSTIAHTLRRMERDGLVTREQDGKDRRRTRVYLTEFSRRLRPELLHAAAEVNRLTLDDLAGDEAARLLHLIQRVIGSLEAELEKEAVE